MDFLKNGDDSKTNPEDDIESSSDFYSYDCNDCSNSTERRDALMYLPDIPMNIRPYLDNDNTFHKTMAFKSLSEHLDKFGSVAVIGPRGSGKTSIAVRVLKENSGKTINGKKCVSIFTCSLDNIEDNIDSTCITVLYMCGVLEACRYLRSHCLKAFEVFERLYTKFVSNKMLYIVLTATDSAWAKFLKGIKVCSDPCKLFPSSQTVQVLYSNEDEKIVILMNHLLNNGFEITKLNQEDGKKDFLVSIPFQPSKSDKESIKGLVKSLSDVAKRDNIGFQVVFQIIANNTLLFKSKENILCHGFMESLKVLFIEMSNSSDSRNRDIFCVLVFMALNDGLISANLFKERKVIYENICSYTVAKVKGWKDVETLLECHMKSYAYPVSTDCFILHISIYTEAILASLTISPKGLKVFIENSSVKELLQRIRRNKLRENEEFVFRLSPNLYQSVIDRLLLEENNPNIPNILYDHVIMESEHFHSLWQSAWSWHQSLKRCSSDNQESFFHKDDDGCFKNCDLTFVINHF